MWQCRPSQLLAIEDEYAAYCLDQACGEWGAHVRSELEKVEGKTRAQVEQHQLLTLRRLLGEDSIDPGSFAAPVATMTREEYERRKSG